MCFAYYLERALGLLINAMFLFVFFGLIACSCAHNVTIVKPKEKIDVHGHRGARAVRFENSLSAFDYALKVGVDVLEMDLVVTKDDAVIVTHDLHVNWKYCKGPEQLEQKGKLSYRSLSLEQVKSITCGVRSHPRFPKQEIPVEGIKIPTLEQVIQLVKASKSPSAEQVRFNIETKIIPSKPSLGPSPREFAALVYDVIEEFNLQNRVILQSFDYRTLEAIKNINPAIKTAQLTYGNYLDFANVLYNQNVDYLFPHHKWLTRKSVRDLHSVGIRVVPWTANSPKEWERLIQLNVDGIITDDPKALIDYLKSRY